MNNIVIRFNNLKESSFFEVSFDKRLSFDDNFRLLKGIYPINMSNYYIYDREKDVFLSKNTPLKDFNFAKYHEFDLFI